LEAEDKEALAAAKKARRAERRLKWVRRGRRVAPGCFAFYAGVVTVAAMAMATPRGMVLAFAIAAVFLYWGLVQTRRERIRPYAWVQMLPPGLGAGALLWVLVPGWCGYVAGAAGLAVLIVGGGALIRREWRSGRGPLPVMGRRYVSVTGLTGLILGTGLAVFWLRDEPPQSFPDLERHPQHVPADQNAFVVLQRTAEKPPWGGPEERSLGKLLRAVYEAPTSWPPDLTARVRNGLMLWSDSLAAVDAALACPRFAAPPRARGEVLSLPGCGVDPWHDISGRYRELVAVRSRLREQEDRPQESLADAVRLMDSGTLMLGGVRGVVDYSMAAGWIGWGTSRVRALAGRLAADSLAQAMDSVPSEERLREGAEAGIRGEFAEKRIMLEWVESPRSWVSSLAGGPPDPDRLILLARRPLLPVLKTNATLNALGHVFQDALTSLDSYPSARFGSQWQSRRATIERAGRIRFYRNCLGYMLAGFFRPYGRTAEDYFGHLADLRLTRVTLALARYRLAHGRLPETLGALAPEFLDGVPVDPFTEKPFIYEPGADPPRVLSVGPEQQLDAPGEEQPDDIVMELPFAATASTTEGADNAEKDNGA
jgi:hypothetical protein